jgi:hypothetical protein
MPYEVEGSGPQTWEVAPNHEHGDPSVAHNGLHKTIRALVEWKFAMKWMRRKEVRAEKKARTEKKEGPSRSPKARDSMSDKPSGERLKRCATFFCTIRPFCKRREQTMP